jgi:hypothetical protein
MKNKGFISELLTFIIVFSMGIGLAKGTGLFLHSPSEDVMGSALKEALNVGTDKAVSFLNQPGGYLNNERFKIPFPTEATNVANKLRAIGMGDKVDKFIETMNHGAENAAIEAKPIFVGAVKQMTITDAKGILTGADNSATEYFKGKTKSDLFQAFSPKIKTALDATSATKYWRELTSTYNKVPFTKKVETDLVKYTTDKALDGLFLKIAEEEKDIRANSNSRPTALLKEVFGWADKFKK